MSDWSHKQLEQRNRLARIREHLDLRTPIDSPAFEQDVVNACRERIDAMLEHQQPRSGEEVLVHVARRLQVRFEEVHDDHDLESLEHKYLREQREIGFAQLSIEFEKPNVDALLFERLHADPNATDKWVAVLNLQETTSRGYWSRSHELIHRIAEPPQFNLRFYRHRNDKQNRLESLIDKGAAELAYYRRLFAPTVDAVRSEPLTWDLIGNIRARYAPSSSQRACVHATLRHWPRPAFLLTARMAGRRRRPNTDVALRIEIQGFSQGASHGVFFFDNMRVPPSSPIWHCFQSGEAISAVEQLGLWTTSKGDCLPDVRALTSAYKWDGKVEALISLE